MNLVCPTRYGMILKIEQKNCLKEENTKYALLVVALLTYMLPYYNISAKSDVIIFKYNKSFVNDKATVQHVHVFMNSYINKNRHVHDNT